MTAVPLDVLRALAVEWRREPDRIERDDDSICNFRLANLKRYLATELDDVADHYAHTLADV